MFTYLVQNLFTRDDPYIIYPTIIDSPNVPRAEPFDALKCYSHCFGGHWQFVGLEGSEYFSHKRNVSNAVASVIVKVARDTDFLPNTRGIITDNELYHSFTQSIPLQYFEEGQGFQRVCSIELDGDYEQYIDAVNAKLGLGMYSGIPEALRELFPKKIEQGQRRWLLQLLTIKQIFENCPVVIQLGQLAITLKRNPDDGSAIIEPQTATLTVTGYIADEHTFVENAEKLDRSVEKLTLIDMLETMRTREEEPRGDDEFTEEKL